MNLTDFRDRLQTRAADADRQQPDPLPVLRSRIRTTKRRRVAVTAAGAALGVALVATGIPAGLDRLGGSEQSPAGPTPASPADVVKDGIRFPGTIGGDTLVKAVIGDVGQEFSFDLDVPAGETEIRPFCVLPGPADYLRHENWVQVLVDGRFGVTSPCGADQGAKVADQFWTYWTKHGQPGVNVDPMKPGKRVRISVRVGNNDLGHPPAPNRQARIGVGVYRLGPMRVLERAAEGARTPELFNHQGHRYRLVDVASRWASEGATLTVHTPAGTPFLVRSFHVGLSVGGQDDEGRCEDGPADRRRHPDQRLAALRPQRGEAAGDATARSGSGSGPAGRYGDRRAGRPGGPEREDDPRVVPTGAVNSTNSGCHPLVPDVTTGRSRRPPYSDGGLAAVSAIGGFEAYVGSNFGRLLRNAYLLTRDRALAEELVQLTLTEARAAWPGISNDPDRYVRAVMSKTLARLSPGP